jgi:hypothetical protein
LEIAMRTATLAVCILQDIRKRSTLIRREQYEF